MAVFRMLLKAGTGNGERESGNECTAVFRITIQNGGRRKRNLRLNTGIDPTSFYGVYASFRRQHVMTSRVMTASRIFSWRDTVFGS